MIQLSLEQYQSSKVGLFEKMFFESCGCLQKHSKSSWYMKLSLIYSLALHGKWDGYDLEKKNRSMLLMPNSWFVAFNKDVNYWMRTKNLY